MASYNVQMNMLNENGTYDVMYPQTLASLVNGLTSTETNIFTKTYSYIGTGSIGSSLEKMILLDNELTQLIIDGKMYPLIVLWKSESSADFFEEIKEASYKIATSTRTGTYMMLSSYGSLCFLMGGALGGYTGYSNFCVPKNTEYVRTRLMCEIRGMSNSKFLTLSCYDNYYNDEIVNNYLSSCFSEKGENYYVTLMYTILS